MHDSDDSDGLVPTASVDFYRVSKSNNFNALARQTATQIMAAPYIALGDWLKDLNYDDLHYLTSVAEHINRGGEPSQSFIILVMMLCVAEGGEVPVADDTFVEIMRRFTMLLCAEALSRKEVAVFHREHATLGAEVDQKEILSFDKQSLIGRPPKRN